MAALSRSYGAGALVVVLLVGLAGPKTAAAQPRPGGGGMEAPKWLTDDGKDLFNDLMADENPYADPGCETREKLLKSMMTVSDRQATQLRFRVLLELGICRFTRGNYKEAKQRIDSSISELNLPSEDMLTSNQDLAHIAMLRQAAEFMKKHELTQAGTALRRAREVLDRILKRIMKMVHKQIGSNAPPLDMLVSEIPGYGRTGQALPQLLKQVPILKQDLPLAEQLDKSIDALDHQLRNYSSSMKAARSKLEVSKGSKSGTLLYVRALPMEPVVEGSRLAAAQQLLDGGAGKALEKVEAKASGTLLKRTKAGSSCKDGKGLEELCAAVAKVADIKSNAFGETRLIVVKAGKKQPLDMCTTNANVGILIAGADGVSFTIGDERRSLRALGPTVVDFCQELVLELEAEDPTAVLFAQAWHPEFAAIERTAELRDRAKTFGLSDEELKDVTKLVNDNAKKHWEKAAKQWRKDSEFLENMQATLKGAEEEAKLQHEKKEEEKRKAEMDGDEERKKGLEELERKRAEKRKKAAEAEEKKKHRQKVLEEERAKRDPWLNDPEVMEVQQKLDDLKEARREANAKLEFDLSTSLTKEISAVERALKKATKEARKRHKKAAAGGAGAGTATKEAPAASDEKKGEAAELRKQLDRLHEEKKAAAKAENFEEAKRLKEKAKEVEAELKKLEL